MANESKQPNKANEPDGKRRRPLLLTLYLIKIRTNILTDKNERQHT